jgi:hypothetical protein
MICLSAYESHLELPVKCLWKSNPNAFRGKDHTALDIVCLKIWRAVDEPDELWSIEYQLMEEGDIQVGQ